ncbi:MAG: hypothetical protein JWQ45_2810 [Blastococcus sp.]|nr:hypothetical protein [Blastococcus sp.]
MSEPSDQASKPSVDITVSNLDVPRENLRETLIAAIDAELERQETQEMMPIDVHLKGSTHLKSS